MAHLSERALVPPPPHARSRIDTAAAALAEASAGIGREVRVDVDELLFGRAALTGAVARGRVSAGGTCRLIPTADGWLAANLARPDDIEAVGALLRRRLDGDVWDELELAASGTTAVDLADRAQLLGIPAAVLGGCAPPDREPPRVLQLATPGRQRRADAATVVDLSSLWAGPLCGQLLACAGAHVVKVESSTRPDGGRGSPQFFTWLNGGKDERSIDMTSAAGVEELRRVLATADVVIESSRPRALRQLGIEAGDLVTSTGATWVSITGYGRDGAAAEKVAFGDDAAVAGGLVTWDGDGLPGFCADAIADPITGLFAAVGALRSLEAGGGRLLDCALAEVAAHVARP